MNSTYSSETLNTLGNAIELATGILSRVAGDVVSSDLGGAPATYGVLSQVIAAKLQQKLKVDVQGAGQ